MKNTIVPISAMAAIAWMTLAPQAKGQPQPDTSNECNGIVVRFAAAIGIVNQRQSAGEEISQSFLFQIDELSRNWAVKACAKYPDVQAMAVLSYSRAFDIPAEGTPTQQQERACTSAASLRDGWKKAVTDAAAQQIDVVDPARLAPGYFNNASAIMGCAALSRHPKLIGNQQQHLAP